MRLCSSQRSVAPADISIELTGTDASDTSGELALLHSSTNADPFERGNRDEFAVSGRRVAEPARLTVWRSGGAAQDWRLEWVRVQHEGTQKALFFRFGDVVRAGARLSACAPFSRLLAFDLHAVGS